MVISALAVDALQQTELAHHLPPAAWRYLWAVLCLILIVAWTAGRKRSPLALGLLAAGLLLIAGVVYPAYARMRANQELDACGQTLDTMGKAIEAYATDHKGRYPSTLNELTPECMAHIPACPAAGVVTYVFVSRSDPDLYTLVCHGRNHLGGDQDVPEDYPQFTPGGGLVVRP